MCIYSPPCCYLSFIALKCRTRDLTLGRFTLNSYTLCAGVYQIYVSSPYIVPKLTTPIAFSSQLDFFPLVANQVFQVSQNELLVFPISPLHHHSPACCSSSLFLLLNGNTMYQLFRPKCKESFFVLFFLTCNM